MSDDPIKKIRYIGNQMVSKSQDLKELAKIIPDQSRKLAAYGEYYTYLADELDRLLAIGVDCRAFPGLNFYELEHTLDWAAPSIHDVTTITVAASACSTSITAPILPYVDTEPDLKLLDNPPESFQVLKATDETIDKLNQLKEGLGETWRNAWNSMAIKDLSSIKNVAINARTVVDGLSWLAPDEDLKKIDWCCLDDKGKPTRATRFAWILNGNELPEAFNKNPSNDPSWKSLKINYDALQKYIHISSLKQSYLIHIEIIMKALQESLENYLNFGYDRLK